MTAVAPAGTGTVDVTVTTPGGTSATSSADKFSYTSSTTLLQFTNWILAGKITPKKLGEAITLPSGSTFNGSGELNPTTGVGSLTGKVAVPAFTATLKLLGLLPSKFGLTIAQSGALEGTLVKSKTISGDETLTLPLKVNLGITSVNLLGLSIPTSCKTTQPISLTLVENLTEQALRTTGWSFTGTTTIPSIKCEGGLLGSLFAEVLSPLFSGPEAAYSINVTAP
jgi:hypothetical protein